METLNCISKKEMSHAVFRLPELLFTGLILHEHVLTLYRPAGKTKLEHQYLHF